MLPQVCPYIVEQIQNLRSNNAKEGLVLAREIVEMGAIQGIGEVEVREIVGVVFVKTGSEKGFLKKEALAAVDSLAKKYNPYLLTQLSTQILSANSQIAQLAAKTLLTYTTTNKLSQLPGQFLSLLIRTINGKRAILQKKGKQILAGYKNRLGVEKCVEFVNCARKNGKIGEEEEKGLLDQLKKGDVGQGKVQTSLKEFLKMKKAESV